MALDMNDIMTLKALSQNGSDAMSPYEQVKVGYMQAKKPSGTAIAGVTVASVAAALGIGAWIFGPLYGNAKAREAREAAVAAQAVANAQFTGLSNLVAANNQSTNANIDRLARTLDAERAERISGDVTLTQTVTDTQSGQQASTLTAQQQSELSALQSVTNTVTAGLMTGQYSQNPQRVALYRDATPCGCPATGCGCNG